MCDVFTMTQTAGLVWGSAGVGQVAAWSVTVMDIVGAVGAFAAAGSAMKGSAATRDMSQYNAAVQKNNQIIAERN